MLDGAFGIIVYSCNLMIVSKSAQSDYSIGLSCEMLCWALLAKALLWVVLVVIFSGTFVFVGEAVP